MSERSVDYMRKGQRWVGISEEQIRKKKREEVRENKLGMSKQGQRGKEC